MENDQRNKLIKSLRAKINFGHPIYLWELLLCVKYILQECNISILNQLRPYELWRCEPIGICTALSKTLYKLYLLQNLRNTTPLTPRSIQYCSRDGKYHIMRLLSRLYSKTYGTIPPSQFHYWFETTEERLKFLDIAIEKFKDSKECYIRKADLTMGHIHAF